MSIEGVGNCQILVSPFPSAVPASLEVQVMAQERRVLLVDSRKPNSLSILEEVQASLAAQGIPCETIEHKVNPVGREDVARSERWAQFRGLLALGIFD